MASITGSISRPSLTLPVVPQVKVAAISAEGVNKVFKAEGMALTAVLLPMIAMFSLSRVLGLSALCYDDLSRQAAMAGLTIMPFAIYCVVLAHRRSLRAVFTVSTIIATVLGALLAATV